MEKNTVLNGNKLIADFMGYEYIPFEPNVLQEGIFRRQPGYWKKGITPREQILGGKIIGSKNYLCRKHDELRYWNSWDWLIPVVQKCITQCKSKEMGILQFKNALLTLDKAVVFNTVVYYIEWYNENTK